MNLQQQIIIQALAKKIKNRTGFDRLRQTVSSMFHMSQPNNQSILKEYRKMVHPVKSPDKSGAAKGRFNRVKNKKIAVNIELEKILKTREIRTLSGVAVITVLTKPFPCPGACIYCPSDARMPKSYLPKEPAAARALMLKFNPYEQVKQRIRALEDNGHETDKIELIVKGGTWSAYPKKYQDWFIKRCFEGANPPKFFGRNSIAKKNAKKLRRAGSNLSDAQKINETAKHRIIGLTLETRPDFVDPEEIKHLRELGCTRIELGVQTIDDKILKLVRRGHTAQDVANATAMLRDAGFKVDYHLMPALPGATPKKDLENFKKIFSDSRFRPDMIKIYPCSIIPKTVLYKWWKNNKYKPVTTKALTDLIIKMKIATPRYVRISRIIRDIPAEDIAIGNKVTNLREYIREEMNKRKLHCKCIRCREVGHRNMKTRKPHYAEASHFAQRASRDKSRGKQKSIETKLRIQKYKTSGGMEYFLSIEDTKQKTLFAFCRLRLPKNHKIIKSLNHKNKIYTLLPAIKDAALIRELHTYGHLVPVDTKILGASQHLGFGRKLMQEAEKIAKQNGYKKMAVIAGIGVREYYRKLKYRQTETYMIKIL